MGRREVGGGGGGGGRWGGGGGAEMTNKVLSSVGFRHTLLC